MKLEKIPDNIGYMSVPLVAGEANKKKFYLGHTSAFFLVSYGHKHYKLETDELVREIVFNILKMERKENGKKRK